MFILIILLLSTINSEPIGSNNYNIAFYILNNLNSLENESIQGLAEKNYVSISSISRFCRHIGLKDFNELKLQIAKYRSVKDSKFHFSGRDEDDLLNSYLDRVILNLKSIKESLDESKLDLLVADIARFKNVYAFGYMQSSYCALNLQGDLLSSGKVISANIKFNDQLNAINNATSDDLIIIFSHSGMYFERAFRNRIPLNRSKKCKIYMITMNKNVTRYSFIDEVISYDSENDYSGHPYPLEVISCLIAMKYAKLP